MAYAAISNVLRVMMTADPVTTIYTKMDGILACFRVGTTDVEEARQTVLSLMSVRHKTPVLALINGGKIAEISPNSVA
jgi:hypothetical protein